VKGKERIVQGSKIPWALKEAKTSKASCKAKGQRGSEETNKVTSCFEKKL
jgi:hypothetical protein